VHAISLKLLYRIFLPVNSIYLYTHTHHTTKSYCTKYLTTSFKLYTTTLQLVLDLSQHQYINVSHSINVEMYSIHLN